MKGFWFIPLAVFAAVAGLLALGLGRDPRVIPSVMIDRPLPAFDLPALDGSGAPGLASTDLGQGKPALINIFASWCVPCRAEHPYLMELAGHEDFALYGINYKDPPEDARAFLAQLGNPYARIGADANGRTAIDFGVYGVPETYVISADGRILHRHVGPLRAEDVSETILPVLRAAGAAKNRDAQDAP